MGAYRPGPGGSGGGGSGGTHGAGTLAARPGAPAAGDTYAVTSLAGTGDVYLCAVAGTWALTSYTATGELAPLYRWKLNELSGTFANSGSGGVAPLTLSGTALRGANTGRQKAPLFTVNGSCAQGGADPVSTRIVSVSCWWRPTETAVGGAHCTLVALRRAAGFPLAFLLSNDDQAGRRVRVSVYTGGVDEHVWRSDQPRYEFREGQLAHVVAVWNGNLGGGEKLAVYLNGVPSVFQAWGGGEPGADLDYDAGVWEVGGYSPTLSANGVVADAQVYDGVALTQAHVSDLYDRGLGAYEGT